MTEMTGRPLYEQIADDLRSKISRGTYAVGDPLPSTTRLMREYGASITAVRAAVNVLKQEGVAIGQPGKAVYVQRQVEPAAARHTDLRDAVDQLADTVRDLAERVALLEKGSGRRSR